MQSGKKVLKRGTAKTVSLGDKRLLVLISDYKTISRNTVELLVPRLVLLLM